MTSIQPVDEAGRRRVLTSLNETLFVEAGAGTGKTTALTGRIVNLVAREGVALQNVAAITFTRKAAGELRDRLRQKLEEAASGEGDFDQIERERCGRAAAEVNLAAIETLDAFVSRIVSENPVEAGLPPRFEALDEVQAVLAFDEAWEEFRAGMLEDATFESTLMRAFALGLKPANLREIARLLSDHWDRLGPETFRNVAPGPVETGDLLEALDAACALMDRCNSEADRLYQHLVTIRDYAGRLRTATDEDELLDVLTESAKITAGNAGVKGNWSGDGKDQVVALLESAAAARTAVVSGMRSEAFEAILHRLCGFAIDFAEQRRREGRQGFHDILVRARNLLLRDGEVRRACHARYQRLLIDEFQDTDPMQIEIAVLIAGEWDGSGEFRWDDVPVEEGRLFFVGDPKQSIYRFRRADIDLYRGVQERFPDKVVHLQANFRSAPGILDWVNGVFEQMISGGPGQAEYVPLEAPTDAAAEGPAVYLLGGPVLGDGTAKPNANDVREIEAKAISGAIGTMVGQGWNVRDGQQGDTRPARYQDVAILLPARTSLSILERALDDAGIPYRVEARSLIYAAEEVRDLLAALRALHDPTDEVALIAALRSPAFACGDDDLFTYHAAGGEWNYVAEPPAGLPPSHPVVESMVWLRETHNRRWALGVAETVELTIRERHFLELALAHPRPRDHWKRLRFVLDQARAATEEGATSLGQFLRMIDQMADSRGSSDTILPDPDDDAVRILTIHASKGLEFPMVVMSGLGAQDGQNADSVSMAWSGRGPEFKAGSKGRKGEEDARFLTPGYDAAAGEEQEMNAEEAKRLLYVAATRARDYLVVGLHHACESHAKRLHSLAETLENPAPEFPASAESRLETPPSVEAPHVRIEALDVWQAARQARIDRSGTLPAVVATAVATAITQSAGEGAGEEEFPDDEDGDEAPFYRRGRGGTSLGRAVHAVLQAIDLRADDSEIRKEATSQATAEGIPDEAREVSRLVRNALNLPTVAKCLRANRRFWREVYVSADFDGITLEGFIDLLIEAEDGYVVVDFKTDAGDPEKAMERYKWQGASYALCVESLLGKRVTECLFLFARHGIEKPVNDLADICADVRMRLPDLVRITVSRDTRGRPMGITE